MAAPAARAARACVRVSWARQGRWCGEKAAAATGVPASASSEAVSASTLASAGNTTTTTGVPPQQSFEDHIPPPAEDTRPRTLWDDCDTAKEIHQANATEGFENVEVQPEHYAAAVRAFAYGTILAVFGVGVITIIGLKYAGFNELQDVSEYMKAGPDRSAREAEARGEKVIRHEINLLEPGSWGSSWDAIVKDLEKLEAEKRKELEKQA